MGEDVPESTMLTPQEELENHFKRNVIPEQQRVINEITVAPVKEKMGEELYHKIQAAFSHDPTPMNPKLKKICDALHSDRDTSAEFRVIKLKTNGRPKRYLVKKAIEGETETTQTFELPKHDLFLARKKLVKLTHWFITDNKTQTTGDLLDLAHPDTKNYFAISYDPQAEGHFDQKKRILRINALSNVRQKSFVFAHESGHAYQQQTFGTLKNNDFTVLRTERNAYAFGLQVIRKYKQLGIDITPNSPSQELISLVNSTLAYDN